MKIKLALKGSGYTTEETVLLKAFKYYDLNDSGMCKKKEFARAISKVGIADLTDEEIDTLFNIYDTDKVGEISYKEFIGVLYGNNSILNEQRNNPLRSKKPANKVEQNLEEEEPQNEDPTEALLLQIRKKLVARGIRGICTLSKNFMEIDENNSNVVDYKEFKKACKDFRFGLSEEELQQVFAAFDVNDKAQIPYDEFLQTVRGKMSEKRRQLVEVAFNNLDKDKSGILDIEDIKNMFNSCNHPDVLNHKKNEDEVLLEFMDTFDATHVYLNGPQCDGSVTLDEFIEYYENVSMCIPDDSFFEEMIENVWSEERLKKDDNCRNKEEELKNDLIGNSREQVEEEQMYPEQVDQAECVPKEGSNVALRSGRPKRKEQQADLPLIEKLRKTLKSRGVSSLIDLEKMFKKYDDNKSKTVCQSDYVKVMNEYKSGLSNEELNRLFDEMDKDTTGIINYGQLIRNIRGDMCEIRKDVVLKAFAKLDSDNSGIIPLVDIKNYFNTKKNKDVLEGIKTESEVFDEFISTFEQYHSLRRGFRDKKVTQNLFVDYYEIVSMCYDDDDDFIELIKTSWKLKDDQIVRNIDDPFEKEEAYKLRNRIGQKMKKIGTPNNAPFGTSNEPVKYGTTTNPEGIRKNNCPKAMDEIIEKFREKVKKRGTRGIFAIRRAFMIADVDDNKKLSLDEFKNFCFSYKMGFSEEDIERLFKCFDKDNSNYIDYTEFIDAIVNEMNDFRMNVVKKVFNKLDANKNGYIDIDDIKDKFSTKSHPDILSGKKNPNEVYAEFLDNLEYHFTLLTNKQIDKITLNDFVDFYTFISFSIDSDLFFEQLMYNAWNLDNLPNFGKGYGNSSNFNFGKGRWKRELDVNKNDA